MSDECNCDHCKAWRVHAAALTSRLEQGEALLRDRAIGERCVMWKRGDDPTGRYCAAGWCWFCRYRKFLDTRAHLASGAATTAMFITGKHPTCPACESIVLPDGKCVNCGSGAATSPAVCTHPGFDESGRCHTCMKVVASAVPCGFARTVAAIERGAAPSTGGALHMASFETKHPSTLCTGGDIPETGPITHVMNAAEVTCLVCRGIMLERRVLGAPSRPVGGESPARCGGTGLVGNPMVVGPKKARCPGCPDCRPTTCRYSNVDCPGPAFCTAAACCARPPTGGDLRGPTTEAALQAVLDEAEERRRAVEHRIMKAAGISPCPNRARKEYVHSERCDAIAAVLEASPVDPVARVRAVRCPVHSQHGTDLFCFDGKWFCASRIRAAFTRGAGGTGT